MKFAITLRPLRLAVAALALPLLAGCGDDTEGPGDNTPDTPLHAFITQVIGTNESSSYIVVTDKVDYTEPVSLEGAIELPGRALGFGVAKSGSLFVAGDEDAWVTRYNLTNEGRLEEAGKVSFSNEGVQSIGEYQHQFQFVSDTKAYYFDHRLAQIIVWNPSDMTVTKKIPLPGVAVEGAVTVFSTLPIRRTDQVLMAVGWRPVTGTGIVSRAVVISVNTKTDTATIVEDPRCGYVKDAVVGPDGLIYLATEVYGAAVYKVRGGDTPVPCLLRFNADSLTFDPAFRRDLGSFVNGGTAGSLLPGPQGTAWLRVLDESKFTITPTTHPRALASASAWTWSKLDLGTLVATPVESLPATSGSTFIFEAGDRTLFTEFTGGSTATNIRDLEDPNGKVTANLSGLTFSFLQLR